MSVISRLNTVLFALALPLIYSPLLQRDTSPDKVRQSKVEKYYRAKNPKDRISIAVQLSQTDLKELVATYKTDFPGERGLEITARYLAAINLLRLALIDSRNPGAAKRAEVNLGQQIRSLEQLMFNLSYEERQQFQPLLDNVRQVHRGALNMVMK